jgi:hypothetical protein
MTNNKNICNGCEYLDIVKNTGRVSERLASGVWCNYDKDNRFEIPNISAFFSIGVYYTPDYCPLKLENNKKDKD